MGEGCSLLKSDSLILAIREPGFQAREREREGREGRKVEACSRGPSTLIRARARRADAFVRSASKEGDYALGKSSLLYRSSDTAVVENQPTARIRLKCAHDCGVSSNPTLSPYTERGRKADKRDK